MALRQIRKEGDEILRKNARTVKEITPAILTLLDDMAETLHSVDGVGLAAPQVGVLRRVVVVEHEDEFYEMINPEIIEREGTQTSNEACLSVPGQCGNIERPMKVVVKAQNRHGEEFTVEGEEFMASVFCHELDHLDGILYIDNATNIETLTEEKMEKRRQERANR